MSRALVGALLLVILTAGAAHATHEAEGQSNAAQNYVSHPDVALIANASAVQILPANMQRVTAKCRIVGAPGTNSARIGDATISASQGDLYDATVPAGTLDVTGILYGYSVTGVTVNCGEVVRQ